MAEEEKKLTAEEQLTADAAKGSAVATDKKDDDVDPQQKLISELQAKVIAAEERAKDADLRAQGERAQRDTARKEAMTSAEREALAKEESIKNAKSAAKNAFESAQKDFEDAYDAGDKKKLIEAQVKLNDAQAALRGAEYSEQNFKAWKENAKKTPANPQEVDLLSNLSQKEKDWVRDNPDYINNERFRRAAWGANERAIARGIEIDSRDYFDFINKSLVEDGFKPSGYSEAQNDNKTDNVVRKAEKSSASSTAAPSMGGSSGTSSGNNGSRRTFRMTSEHREAAAFIYPDLYRKNPKEAEEKYAIRQLEIMERREKGEKI